MTKHQQLSRDLIVMTPIIQSSDCNVIKIRRYHAGESVPGNVLHVAGGEHTGIVVRKHDPDEKDNLCAGDEISLNFTVWLASAKESGIRRQENRVLRFFFYPTVSNDAKHKAVQNFFKELLSDFPNDYPGFLKKTMKLVQRSYAELKVVEIDMRYVQASEAVEMPRPKEYGGAGDEVESLTMAHVQDILESAYPNGLTVQVISESLRASVEETEQFLRDLAERRLAKEMPDTGEWVRVGDDHNDESSIVRQMPRSSGANQPTVAIISAFFCEKQAVDAMIDNKQTLYRYKSDGESNIYTLGEIGHHRVVATKVSILGNKLECKTALGSITTRLLGNFQNVEHVLMIGCGGGVAHFSDKERHVRLGDVVVSCPVDTHPYSYVYCDKLQLDRDTEEVRGFVVRKFTPKNNTIARLVKKSFPALAEDGDGVAKGHSHSASNGDDGDDLGVVEQEWSSFAHRVTPSLNETLSDRSNFTFSRPSPDTDVLALPVGDGTVVVVPHPNKERTISKVHIGPIGAGGGERMARDSALLGRFTEEFGVRACDQDFDSVIEAIIGSRVDSWAVIRGVADYKYGDSNETWKGYAALHAAAFAKALIMQLPKEEE